LCVNAVEGDGDTEAFRIASEGCQGNLGCVSDRKRLARCDKTGEGRVWASGPEKVEKGRGGDESDGRCRIAVRCRKALAERARSDQEYTARASCNAGIGRAAGDDHCQRVAYGEPGFRRVQSILVQKLRIRGIDVLWPVEMQAAGPLITQAKFPGAGDFTLDGE